MIFIGGLVCIRAGPRIGCVVPTAGPAENGVGERDDSAARSGSTSGSTLVPASPASIARASVSAPMTAVPPVSRTKPAAASAFGPIEPDERRSAASSVRVAVVIDRACGEPQSASIAGTSVSSSSSSSASAPSSRASSPAVRCRHAGERVHLNVSNRSWAPRTTPAAERRSVFFRIGRSFLRRCGAQRTGISLARDVTALEQIIGC